MARETNLPESNIGDIPGSLVKHEFATESRVRLIEYDKGSHRDLDLGTESELKEVLELDGYVRTDREVHEFVLASLTRVPGTGAVSNETGPPAIRWINVDGLGDVDLLRSLGKRFGLHPLAMEDVVNVNQRAKTDVYDTSLFITLREPNSACPLATEQFSIFLLDNVVLTLQEYPGDCLDPVRERIAAKKGRIRSRGADYLAYAIMDAIIDAYFPVLDQYEDALDAIDEEIEELPQNIPHRLHAVRADLLGIRKTAQQMEESITLLLREDTPMIDDGTEPFLRDCLDHVKRLIEMADTYRETCGELRELYFALLGQRTNDAMKVLTVIATLFIPMSFVAGVYGMNFDSGASPYNMPELHWYLGYPTALLLMFCTGGGLLIYLRRKNWL